MVKRGLIVSFYFPPMGGGGVQRWVKLIKYMQPLGWEFCVISSGLNQTGPYDKTLLQDIPAQTKIIRIPEHKTGSKVRTRIPFFNRSGYWQRWLSAFIYITDSREVWNRKAYRYIKNELNTAEYDVLIVSSPPYSLAVLASELNKELELPVILDLRDPWTINPYKIHPTPIHKYLDQKREEKAIANIEYIVSAYKSSLKNYYSRVSGFMNKRTLYLPNGFDNDDFSSLKKIKINTGFDLHIGFSGSFYSHLNTPLNLFAALKLLKRNNINVCFHHIGSSVYDLKAMARRYGINDNIKIWGYRNHKECLKILNAMDILCLILDSNWPNSENTIGGKFYEYLRLYKPILGLVPGEGEAAEAIQETESGVIVPDNQIQAIAKAILQIKKSEISLKWKNIERYDRRKLAEDLQDYLINEVIRSGSISQA